MTLPKKQKHEKSIADPRDTAKLSVHPEPNEPTLEILLERNRLDRIVMIGSELPEEEPVQLINFLAKNIDVFA